MLPKIPGLGGGIKIPNSLSGIVLFMSNLFPFILHNELCNLIIILYSVSFRILTLNLWLTPSKYITLNDASTHILKFSSLGFVVLHF